MPILRVRKVGTQWVPHKFGAGDPITVDPGDGFTYGVDRPDASTAGVINGITRTNFNSPSTTGDVSLTTAGVTYENLNFYGNIKRRANNLTFKNCAFYGGIGHPSGNTGCLDMNSDHTGTVLTRCTATAQDPSYYRDGFVGRNYVADRCRAYNVNDGFGAFSAPGGNGICNVEIKGCYVHTLVFWGQDPAHFDGTHNDCVQYQGGANFTAFGNRLVGDSITDSRSTTQPNSKGSYINGTCLIINQNTAPASNVVLRNNWLELGSGQVQLNCGSYASMSGVTLENNIYGRNIFNHYAANPDYRWVILYSAKNYDGVTGIYDSQRFADTGALLTVGRATGIRVL